MNEGLEGGTGEEGGTGWGGGRYGGGREVPGWEGGTKEVECGQYVLCTLRKLSEN